MSFYSIDQFIREHYPHYWGYQTYPQNRCVCIRKVSDEWGIFCNFAHTPLEVEGVMFKSSEELFQLMKFKDAEIVNRIRNNITREGKRCCEVKRTTRSYEKEHRRDDWGTMVIDAMKFCLQTKYEQSEEFRRKLESTRGLYIVEDQTSLPKRNPDAWGVKPCGTEFSGPNLLGRLLMELRDNGSLAYTLPPDALDLLDPLKQSK
jgi:ribA/ribD-fused uncharacterized protein